MVYSGPMRGLHLTADLYQCRCDPDWLTDAENLGEWARTVAEAVGLQVEHELSYESILSGGATSALMLPGSHMVLHTWPAKKGVTVDVFLSNPDGEDLSAKARGLMYVITRRFQPEWTEQRSLDRGDGE